MMKRDKLKPGINDLATLHPEISKYWSNQNNKASNSVLPGSGNIAFWKCDRGHERENVIRQEVNKNNHCQQCFTSIPKKSIPFEKLSQKYSPKNEKAFTPNLPKTRMFLWDCTKCETTYSQTLKNELAGVNCPYCSGKKIKAGINDIATLFPHLVPYWSSKNKNSIKKYGKGSQSSVFWECFICTGIWESAPNVQTRKIPGHICPYCSGNKLLAGFNDLATIHPKIETVWHPTKNLPSTPELYLPSSSEKVWWHNTVCSHEWQQTIISRIRSSSSCSVCKGTVIIPGVNSLFDLKPYLKLYWDNEKNTKDPTLISPNGSATIYLKCPINHSWETQPQRVTERITCQVCSNKKIIKGFNDLATTHPNLAAEWHPTKNLPDTPDIVPAGTHKKIFWICKNKHEWETKGNDRVNYSTGCPQCVSFKTSAAEKEIANWIEESGINIQRNLRKIITLELDIYVPEKNIAIEYNGLYWHSEASGKTKNYHYDKWLACKEKGIQLIQIWEDDWKRNPELVKRMLNKKLGISNGITVYARKTYIQNLTKSQAEKFLDKNHIQGYVSGSYYLGLFNKEELVAVLVLKKEPGTDGKTLNIIRYATSCNVPGGFTKLLKYAEKTYTPEQFITFSDNCVSDGGLYENNGFFADKQLAPDYMYVVKNERKHKFGYRLKRFSNDPELQYQPGLTERELAALNGLHRVWDAGKTRWVKNISADKTKE